LTAGSALANQQMFIGTRRSGSIGRHTRSGGRYGYCFSKPTPNERPAEISWDAVRSSRRKFAPRFSYSWTVGRHRLPLGEGDGRP
jgi:hypothetical protein